MKHLTPFLHDRLRRLLGEREGAADNKQHEQGGKGFHGGKITVISIAS
jgi:hypothetical protein